VCVEAGAQGGAADRELAEPRQRSTNRALRLLELRHIAGKLLAESERRGVLQVGAADFDDAREGVALLRQSVFQGFNRGNDPLGKNARGGDMHRGREYVIGGLAEVDI